MPLILLVVDTGSMDDILKVVVPGSMGEETTVSLCKRCGEVHDVKDIEKYHRIRREHSRCTRCGLERCTTCLERESMNSGWRKRGRNVA
jgi:hypothetical protein